MSKMMSLEEMGWTKKQQEAALNAKRKSMHGKKVSWFEREMETPERLYEAVETAKRWEKSYRHAVKTGKYYHPESKRLLGSWPLSEGVITNFTALLKLNLAAQANLTRRLSEMGAHI